MIHAGVREMTRMIRTVLVVLAIFLLALIGIASAEPAIQFGQPGSEAPPVAVGPGWRYERRGDVHVFHCMQESCNRTSRVSYRLYRPDTSLTLEKFRQGQQEAAKALEQRGPPGTRITIVRIEGDDGGKLPRMYKSTRTMTVPNAPKEFVISSALLGARLSATLISSSTDEKATDTNHALFGVAVMLLINSADTKR
jgi:hypothetical protein